MTNIQNEFQWYIITAINGNEDVVYKNLEDKIRAYNLNEFVHEIKLLKSREITIEIFDNKINPPPKSMRNTKSITWETLPGNKYKKTRIREINRFPGYIYIKMSITPEVWYTIRNTFGVTGFVGSSGKGTSPIPMSNYEVEELFNLEKNKDIVINKSNISYADNNLEEKKAKEVKVEFFDNNSKTNNNDFYNSQNIDIFNSYKKLEAEENLIKEAEEKTLIKEEISTNKEQNKKEELSNQENNFYLDDDKIIDENILNYEKNIDHEDEDMEIAEHDFQIGNSIKIISGGMIGQTGLIISMSKDKKMITIEIDFLGRKNILTVKFNEIEKNIN